jgi:hypothetical protein
MSSAASRRKRRMSRKGIQVSAAAGRDWCSSLQGFSFSRDPQFFFAFCFLGLARWL